MSIRPSGVLLRTRFLVACVVLALCSFLALTVSPAASADTGVGGSVAFSRVLVAAAGDLVDADGDRIGDDVEIAVCGTKTCATGLEDRDGDGIPDWTEVLSCGDRTCASPTKDRDGDGIPDFAERLVCGSDTCSNSTEDADGDGIGDWVEFVICGDRTCATGAEDYDGDGVSDAVQLAACVKRVDSLALTGQPWFWGLMLAAVAAMGAGGFLWWRRVRAAAREVEAVPVAGSSLSGGE